MNITYKDWDPCCIDKTNLIGGGSTTDGKDRPVVHPIGVAPQAWSHFQKCSLKQTGKNKLCYSSVTASGEHSYSKLRRSHYSTVQHNLGPQYLTTCNPKLTNFNSYFDMLKQHKFCFSPEGNGVDCHRHYESILAKCIPIIKVPVCWDSSYMRKYNDLPVLWTTDYSDITIEYLNHVYDTISNTVYNFDKLTYSYWRTRSTHLQANTKFWLGKYV